MNRYFDEFEVGVRYPTRTRRISDEDQLAFCRLTAYDVPLFLDDAYAKSLGLAGRLCPSHLIMSFSSAMTGDLFSESLIALVGLERAKFLAPVYPGDTLRTEVEVIEKRPSSKPDRGVVVFRDHVYNQHGAEVFCNDKIILLRRKPSA
ncbi:MAG: MaoC family dehydratase [Proteobacteria bacterium]|jgi:acyl dehydratase|nr:MaoC family dehydratase [Betaproteobacteria bacterium]MCX7137047.1 MaoC family dehydratase [Pseudomonadota bacterium]